MKPMVSALGSSLLALAGLMHMEGYAGQASGLSIPAASNGNGNRSITRRAVTASQFLSDFRSAQFVISSSQTSCEVALVNSIGGFVAASCLKFKSDGNADNSIDYRVAVNDPLAGTSKIYSVDSVDVHPSYNPATFANNVAFVMFNWDASVTWTASVASDPAAWDNAYYTSRTLSSISKATWNTPAIIQTAGAAATDDAGCSAASALFSANKDSMRCLSTSATSVANNKCNTPFGAAWAIFQPNDIAVGALYSHSVVYGGTSLCGASGNQFHYYTLLQPYVAWGAKKLGKSISTFTTDSSFSYSGSTSFSLANSGAGAVAGTTLISGDQYPIQKAYTGSSSASNTNTSPSTSTGSNSSSGSSNNSGSSGSGSNSSGSNSSGSNSSGSNNSGSSGSSANSSGSNSSAGSNTTNNNSSPSTTSAGEADGASATEANDSNKSTNSSNGGDSNSSADGSSNDDSNSSGGEEEINDSALGFSVVDDGAGSFDYGDSSGTESSADSDGSKAGDAAQNGADQNGGIAGNSTPDSDGYNGLGRTATIVVATVVPIGTIAILIALFFLYKWYRRYRNKFSWDPKSEAATLDRIRIIDEISVNSSPEADGRLSSRLRLSQFRQSSNLRQSRNLRQSTPPSYDDHQFEGNISFADKAQLP
ncbi:hypothetical protein GGH99_004772 [Coemansia sp. RSA 1285]|nr:hypothetical protein GGH99_004772 [Coemansia sp. RSA 1285]